MACFYNGDRVCFKKSHSSNRVLQFGRVQEYVQDTLNHPASSSAQFSEYGDVLSTDDTFLSSCVSPPPLDTDGGGKSLRNAPLLQLLSSTTSSKSKKSPFASGANGGDVGKAEQSIPGLVSPIMMKRSKSQPDMMEQMKQSDDSDENRERMKNIKRRIIWDNGNKKETEILGEKDANLYKVVDRKFSVGQVVGASNRYGKRGKVVEVKPLATVHVPFSDPDNKQETAHVIRDLNLADIKPISPLFCGVTIEFNGWIGQISEVERQVVYKLEDSTYLTRKFQDSLLLRKSRNAPSSSEALKEQRTIQNQFSYPFMKNTEMPFTGKVERFSPQQLQQLKIEEEEDKENNQNNRYSTRSKTGSTSSSSSPPTLPLFNMEFRKKSKADRENFITAIVESVSIVSVKVRWTGRLPAYLIKPKSEATTTAAVTTAKEKASSKWNGALQQQQACISNEGMPPTTIRSAEDVKRVRPLYINPAMYFEKKGLCAYTTDKRNEEIMIPERLWAYELHKEAGDNNSSSSAEVVAPFNLSTIVLSPPPPTTTTNTDVAAPVVEEKKGKDSCMKNTDDYNNQGKRKRCHDEDATKDEESGGGGGGGAGSRRTVIVCKHFVRHFYKVVWEDNKKLASKRRSSSGGDSNNVGPEWWCGTKLYPIATQEHKLCLGLIHSHLYVVPRTSSCMYGKCDYGVVVEKPTSNSIVVDWMKIQKGGSVNAVRILKCDLLDIEKHQKFNELHEGRIVVRNKDADGFKGSREFCFGTIVRVNRFGLGQISVYSATQEKIIELWPHMVELFVGMSMKDLIAQKIVGIRKLSEQNNNK